MVDGPFEDFLRACGATGPIGLRVETPDGTLPVTLGRPFAIIGRNPEADIVLDDPAVGPRHSYLQLVAGHLLCLDIQNPPSPNSKRPRCAWLAPGRALRVGANKVRLVSGAPEVAVPISRRQLPSVTLADAAGNSWKFRRPLTLLGSSSGCKVQIDSPGVSPTHAALVVLPQGVWVVDLLGVDGVAVNRHPVIAARCHDGDRLRVGRAGLHVAIERPAAAREPELIAPQIQRLPALADVANLPELLAEMAGAQQMMAQHRDQVTLVLRALADMHRDQARLLREEMARVDQLSRELAALKAEQARLAGTRPAQAAPLQAGPLRPAAKPPRLAPPRAAEPPAEPPAVPATPAAPPADVHAWLDRRVAELQRDRATTWGRVRNLLGGQAPDAPPSGN